MYANRTPEQIDAANKYHTWRRGWSDGAGGRMARDDHKNHPKLGSTYVEAYDAGRAARIAMHEEATKKFGHVPTILRAVETDGVSTEKEGEEQ